MAYANDSPNVLAAMEQARTGNHGADGYDYETYECPGWGAEDPDKFYIDDYGDCVGCTECISESGYPDGRDFL